ncbi:MAG: hypothetical protein WC384_11050 [Prolixibacteraceae bacterium]|jgi:hypothetical protein
MNLEITKEELDFIIESLEYTKVKFDNYDNYPTAELKKDRIDYVVNLKEKLKALKEKI